MGLRTRRSRSTPQVFGVCRITSACCPSELTLEQVREYQSLQAKRTDITAALLQLDRHRAAFPVPEDARA